MKPMHHRAVVLMLVTALLCTLPLTLGSCFGKTDTTLTADVLKIGQADCIIINEGENTVVIDCGEIDDSSEIVAQLKTDGVDEIDYLIITHFDKDHIGGAPAVLAAYSVKNLIEPLYTPEDPESEAYLAYQQALEANGVTARAISEDMDFSLGESHYEIMTAGGKTYTKNIDNNASLMIGLEHSGNSFLFAGDVEKQRIDDILDAGIGHYDFLKIPHHGVYNKSTIKFLQAVTPQYAAITCSAKNQPETGTLEALDSIGCAVYSTKDSEVHITSSQDGLHIDQSGV